MNNPVQDELICWLSKQRGISDIVPISIRIENEAWAGAKYLFTGTYDQNMDAVTRGQKKAGKTYQEERYYFFGELPKSYDNKGGRGVCYMGPNGEEFYVSCYITEKILKRCSDEQKKYHPFGPSFMLGAWPKEFGPIDQYESKPYRRITLSMSSVN